jgi:hypothetical protein
MLLLLGLNKSWGMMTPNPLPVNTIIHWRPVIIYDSVVDELFTTIEFVNKVPIW